MKKILSLALMLAAVSFVNAQDATSSSTALTSKKGIPILPETDEWGLGISGGQFLGYLGNFFHGTAFQNPPGYNFPTNPTNIGSIANNIAAFGKLIKDPNTAYRVRFNVGVNTNINKAVIAQNLLTPDPAAPAFTEDWQKISNKQVVIAAGLEKRRGKSRVQGIYGGELVIGFTSAKTEYQYGNPMTLEFNAPITNNFGNNILTGAPTAASSRKTSEKGGSGFLLGARGFIGVEYFFAPKVSIGGEFGYMLGLATQSRGLTTSESWNGVTNATRETKTDFYNNNGLTSIGIGLDNLNGAINILFYF